MLLSCGIWVEKPLTARNYLSLIAATCFLYNQKPLIDYFSVQHLYSFLYILIALHINVAKKSGLPCEMIGNNLDAF